MLTTPFEDVYDGHPAVRLTKAAQLLQLQGWLMQHKVSYRTKIVKRRNKAPEYIVMLVEPPNVA